MAGKDRLTEAHQRLTAAVESLVSGEDWQQLLMGWVLSPS